MFAKIPHNFYELLGIVHKTVDPGSPYRKGRLSTVDLLAPTSLVQLIFMFKILLTFVTKQAALIRRSSVQSLALQLGFPGQSIPLKNTIALSRSQWKDSNL